MLCAWVHEDPSGSELINGILVQPTDDAVGKFHRFAQEGRASGGWSTKHFRSVTLAANGGRIVVRRWLDVPLSEAVESVNAWLDDLELAVILPPPPKGGPRSGKKPASVAEGAVTPAKTSRPYRSLDALAWATARTPSDVRSDVYDALLRGTYGKESNPEALLPAVLHRLRIATIESGANVRYHANRFALIKLILKRKGGNSMPIERKLCITHDPPYNCGRLLAVLDNLQYQAMRSDEKKDVGADILARFYARASTVPVQVFPSLLQLAQSHLKKLARSPKTGGLSRYFDNQIAEVLGLFKGDGDRAPSFPGLLTAQEQGRFALGFYQQKAHREPSEGSGAESPQTSE